MTNVKKPTSAELEALSSLAKSVISSDLSVFPNKARDYYFSGIAPKALESRLQTEGIVLSAWDGERVTGFLMGTAPEGNVATIIWVLVAPTARKKGIGAALFREACKHYKSLGCHKIKLTAPNEKLKTFYEKLGMKEEGFHPNHWWGMDFWSFGKEL